MAAAAFLAGAVGAFQSRGPIRAFVFAGMMVIFLNAARVAMKTFDPYLSSAELAMAYKTSPPGEAILDNQYYAFSSVVFYGDMDRVHLLNGRVNNLEYGSYAPGAPQVFIDDCALGQLWKGQRRRYLFVEKPAVPRIERILGKGALHLVKESGGKYLFSNGKK
jgi:hypothetical protein